MLFLDFEAFLCSNYSYIEVGCARMGACGAIRDLLDAPSGAPVYYWRFWISVGPIHRCDGSASLSLEVPYFRDEV